MTQLKYHQKEKNHMPYLNEVSKDIQNSNKNLPFFQSSPLGQFVILISWLQQNLHS